MWSYGSVSRKTHFSSSLPGPLIVHGLPVSCPFNFPNGNLKQQWSHKGVFICYQNIDAKKIRNLHIYGIQPLSPYKTVVSHLKIPDLMATAMTRKRKYLHSSEYFAITPSCSLSRMLTMTLQLYWCASR